MGASPLLCQPCFSFFGLDVSVEVYTLTSLHPETLHWHASVLSASHDWSAVILFGSFFGSLLQSVQFPVNGSHRVGKTRQVEGGNQIPSGRPLASTYVPQTDKMKGF